MKRKILFLAFLQIIFASKSDRSDNAKKTVRFKGIRSDEGVDFNFGEPVKKTRKKQHVKPGQVIFSSKTRDNPEYSSSSSNAKSSERHHFYNPKLLEKANIFMESEDGDAGPYTPPNPYRNVGPTPEFLSAVGPERFWLPPNAPMQQEIPGPWLPYYRGVPGTALYDNRLRVEDAALPQVTGLTGPRDPQDEILSGPTFPEELSVNGAPNVNTFVPPYQPPCMLTPLNPVTPLPGGNIIDPISPQVTNVRGPFFPDDLRADGAYLLDADAEDPQLFAQNFEDGPFVVERVVDPIVFFDPSIGQTVVFDPIRNFTRLYNPETDPELPIDSPLPVAPSSIPPFNGGNAVLKTTFNSIDKPSFWIMKRAQASGHNLKSLEKATQATINGQQAQIHPKPQTNGKNGATTAGRIIHQPPGILKKVNHPPTQNTPQQPPKNSPQPTANQFRIQLKENPNVLQKKQTDPTPKTKGSPITNSGIPGRRNKHSVIPARKPVVETDISKRYSGFKANSHSKNSAQLVNPSIISLMALTTALFLML